MSWLRRLLRTSVTARSQAVQGAIAPLSRPLTALLVLTLTSCLAQSPSTPTSPEPTNSDDLAQIDAAETDNAPSAETEADIFASVTAVEASAGEPGAYTFAVTIASPDTGCGQFANWWEVVDEEGNLIFRRILVHSHVEEQPFTRAGGAVAVQPDQPLFVRAHMYPHGYGTQAMQGSVDSGFEETTLPEGFAAALAQAEPQPVGCEY